MGDVFERLSKLTDIPQQYIYGIDPQDLPAFVCFLCSQVLVQPMVTTCCREVFCATCIAKWLTDRQYCPIHGTALNPQMTLPHSNTVYLALNSLFVWCVNQQKGCPVVLKLNQFESHLPECLHPLEYICRPSIGINNTIDYEFGFHIKLNQIMRSGIKKDVIFSVGEGNNVFTALFDGKNFDFEVIAENKFDGNVALTISGNEQTKKYVLEEQSKYCYKSLQPYGKRFHFSDKRVFPNTNDQKRRNNKKKTEDFLTLHFEVTVEEANEESPDTGEKNHVQFLFEGFTLELKCPSYGNPVYQDMPYIKID